MLEKSYSPNKVEDKIYQLWESHNSFAPQPNRIPFCIVIPPPNVTGSLHMGHALNITLQDIIIRYKRMRGYRTLWLPGLDHAGIATQYVLEQRLKKENKRKEDLGKEKFLRLVWEHKAECEKRIIKQLKSLGASCYWDYLKFTLDDDLSYAVRFAFAKLFKEGYIYRGECIVNWCTSCNSALSDLEVNLKEVKGSLYYIRYPTPDLGYLLIATTRPETMLGDTALAVNPKDTRYKGYLNKFAYLPLLGRKLPIIPDSVVKEEFGSGILKVTPAHDFVDFDISLRHNLPKIKVFTEDGKINEEGGKYKGLKIKEAREIILQDLIKEGLFEREEPYSFSLGYCYRCNTPVEPLLSTQWFLKTGDLAKEAKRVVEEGEIKFIPNFWENMYFSWLDNIRDWCISRQIWWGHRIPIWYCETCGEINCTDKEEMKECANCNSSKLTPETDVLDTWFSSALWPFSTLGFPQMNSNLLKEFYPTSILVTGFDIIFFWVARMIMLGLKFMGKVPFREVYIHALVRTGKGEKMSKSKGNIIEPEYLQSLYGTCALRFTLAALTQQGRDIKLEEKRLEGYRHFANKLWNAARFIFIATNKDIGRAPQEEKELDLAHLWILKRLQEIHHEVTLSLDNYNFSRAASLLYQFVWHEYCDYFIEIAKLSTSSPITRYILFYTFSQILILLHPIMPFLTEELWQELPPSIKPSPLLISTEWPKEIIFSSSKIEEKFNLLRQIIQTIRHIKACLNIPVSYKLPWLFFNTKDKEKAELLAEYSSYIKYLANIEGEIKKVEEKPKNITLIEGYVQGVYLYLPLPESISWEKEKSRLNLRRTKLEKELDNIERRLSSPPFLKNAPSEHIINLKNKKSELNEELTIISTLLGSNL